MNAFKKLNAVKIFLLMFGLVICQAAMAGKVSVKSADPSESEQGTINLDVTIAGSGFDNSAQAVFLVSGSTTNPGGVVVHSTAFVRSSKLVARISIDGDASVGDFDIEVQMSRGRGGKGTTLFKVQSKGGSGTLTEQDTTQQWTGSGEITSNPRNCWAHGSNATTGYAAIGCDTTDRSNTVNIQFIESDIIASGRKPLLCELLFVDPLVFGDVRTNRITGFEAAFGTEWNDGNICLDDGSGTTTCEIWVRHTAFGYMCHPSELVSGVCKRERLIILEGVGTGDAAEAPELNPFTVVDQAIDLNELTFWIKGIGKNRTDATCSIDFLSSDPPVVIFHTTPRFDE